MFLVETGESRTRPETRVVRVGRVGAHANPGNGSTSQADGDSVAATTVIRRSAAIQPITVRVPADLPAQNNT